MANTKKYVSLDKLGVYDQLIKAKIAADDATQLKAAKDYADSLADNYDAAGSASSALADAQAYADGKDVAIAEAKKAGTDASAALETYKTSNDAAVEAVALDVANLDTYVGDIPSGYTETNVIAYINKKAEQTLSAATGDGGESAASVKQALDTYKAENDAKVTANATAAATAQTQADKGVADAKAAQDSADAANTAVTELAGKVGTVPADKTVVQMIADAQTSATYDDTEVRDLIGENADAIAAEKARMDAFMTLNEGETLNQALDSLKEIQDFITNEANDADILLGKVSALEAIVDGIGDTANGEKATVVAYVTAAIDALKIGDYAKAADLIALIERVTTVEGKVATLEGTVALKADKTALDSAVETLEGADSDMSDRITVLEGKFGGADGSVEDQIADAQAAAIASAKEYSDTQDTATLNSAKGYTDAEIDKVEATVSTLSATVDTKAAQTDLTALTTRVSNNETAIEGHGTRLTAVEAQATQNKTDIATANTEIAKKAAKTDLDAAVTRITTIETWHKDFVEVSEEEINSLFA